MGVRVRRGSLVLPPVRIIVTGSSKPLGNFYRQKVLDVVDKYRKKYPKALWVTGACVNVDELVAFHLNVYGETVYTVVPADKDHIDKNYRHHCSLYEIMPMSCGNTKSERYMARNQRMVDVAAEMDPWDVWANEEIEQTQTVICLAFPDKPETNRSGTWGCVRRARHVTKQIVVTELYGA